MNTLRMAMYNRFVMEEILHVDPTCYDLRTKGDDVVVFTDLSQNTLITGYQ
jgi:hypothetical protein